MINYWSAHVSLLMHVGSMHKCRFKSTAPLLQTAKKQTKMQLRIHFNKLPLKHLLMINEHLESVFFLVCVSSIRPVRKCGCQSVASASGSENTNHDSIWRLTPGWASITKYEPSWSSGYNAVHTHAAPKTSVMVMAAAAAATAWSCRLTAARRRQSDKEPVPVYIPSCFVLKTIFQLFQKQIMRKTCLQF